MSRYSVGFKPLAARLRRAGRGAGRIALISMAGLVAQAGDAAAALDPARVGWTEVRFHASKFFLSAEASLKVEQGDAGQYAGSLMAPGTGKAVDLDDDPLMMVIDTRALGRDGHNILLMNGRSGAAVQFIQSEADRYRITRFTDIGRFRRTWRPEKNQRKLPHEQWTDRSDSVRDYPPDATGQVVVEAGALIYIIAAAPLAVPGDRYEVLTPIKRQLFRVVMEVASPRKIKTSYTEHSPSGTVRRKGRVEPLRILIRGEGLNAEDDEKFQLLGLQGDIELFLQPDTRLPLQLSGKIKILGEVNFRLREATLR